VRGKCESCRGAKATGVTVDGVKLCQRCLSECAHAETCTCHACREIKGLKRAIADMADAVKACVAIARYADYRHGSWMVTGANVDRCEQAAKRACRNKRVLAAVEKTVKRAK